MELYKSQLMVVPNLWVQITGLMVEHLSATTDKNKTTLCKKGDLFLNSCKESLGLEALWMKHDDDCLLLLL